MSKGTDVDQSKSAESVLVEVRAYLARCTSLREALMIEPDDMLEPQLLGMGEHNINFAFNAQDGRAFVLRVNVVMQPFHENQILYEYHALEAALPSGCTPKPQFIDYAPSAPGKGVLVETFCQGEQLNFDALRPGDIRCAIQMMADVHAVVPREGCQLFQPADPLEEMFGECVQRFRSYLSSGFEDPRITRWTQQFIDVTERMLERVAPPQDREHIVNTETLPSHFLIPAEAADSAALSPAGGRLCAHPGHFVDWERCILGEIAQDVAYFVSPTTTYWDSEFLFPVADIPSVLDLYWQAVGGRFAPKDFEERFAAWRMMTALKSTTWCVQAIPRYSTDMGIHTTEKTAGKLPVYLSDEFMERIAVECFGL